MKLLGYFHLYPTEHMAGSETTVHAALRAMARRGHTCTVICDRSVKAPYAIDGVEVVRPPRRNRQRWLLDLAREQDLLVTHLDLTSQAMQLVLDVKKPLAHFVHNDGQLTYWRVNMLKAQLVIFNSHWIAESEKQWHWLRPNEAPTVWPGPSVTVNPVVEPEHYRCERGEAITLVNPTSGKGAATFYALAQHFPEQRFITAQGGYGHQVACPHIGAVSQHHPFYDETGSEQNCYGLPNVTHLRNDPDVRNVFRRTRVLLMPSDYESYGRVGVEAACAGIPTIAHPTEGLKEAFGDAAIFCDRADIDVWANEIERLLNDEVYYRSRSDAALALADSLQPEAEFDRLESAFTETVARWQQAREAGAMNIWISDRVIWTMKDGGYKVEPERGRIPQNAAYQFAGVGTHVPRDLAIEQGWIGEQSTIIDIKAIEEPAENKMIVGPSENKSRKVRAA